MKIPIDILVVNNCPSFYKINLYNELAKYCKVHVIFIGLTNQVVINQDFQNEIHFSFELLSNIQIEKRNKLKSIFLLFKVVNRFKFKKIIYGGYRDFEEQLFMFLTPKRKNCLQFESSIRESNVGGLFFIIKKLFFNRFSIALFSGKLQSAVFEKLYFKGYLVETKGVGLFNMSPKIKKRHYKHDADLKYIYVGRLIPIKNIELLIRVFNRLNKSLTIVGTGVLERSLQTQANLNIKFTGFIPNNEINKLYCAHDVFILPSISEPWGLVVEEAIYFGLPVIVSDAVGCQDDMVIKPNTGVVFTSTDENDLLNAILKIEMNIETYRKNCKSFDFHIRNKEQIEAYLKILNL